MMGRKRYICTGCRTNTKLLPRDTAESIRTGCGLCDSIRRYVVVGSTAHHVVQKRGETNV